MNTARVGGLRVGAIATAALIAVGCGERDAGMEWAGTVVDSAGIQVVNNPVEGVWAAGEEWVVEEVLSIGEMMGAEEFQFGQIVGVDVDSDGNIYVADMQGQDIRVYDATGSHLRTIGRPGSGPGEIGLGLSGVYVLGDEVIAPDIGNARMSRFNREGNSIGSYRVALEAGIPLRWDRVGDALVAQLRPVANPNSVEPTGDLIVSMGDPEAPRDTMAQLPVGQSMQFVGGAPRARIFAPEPIWDAGADGRLIIGENGSIRIAVHGPDGSVLHVITKPTTPKAVTERDRRVFLDVMRDAVMQQGAPAAAAEAFLQTVQFAETYPAFATMSLGPHGSVWVQKIRSGDEIGGEEDFDAQDVGSPTWDIFNADGRYLGELTFPGKYQPIKVEGDLIYGIDRDDLDVQRMKVYRVVTG